MTINTHTIMILWRTDIVINPLITFWVTRRHTLTITQTHDDSFYMYTGFAFMVDILNIQVPSLRKLINAYLFHVRDIWHSLHTTTHYSQMNKVYRDNMCSFVKWTQNAESIFAWIFQISRIISAQLQFTCELNSQFILENSLRLGILFHIFKHKQ